MTDFLQISACLFALYLVFYGFFVHLKSDNYSACCVYEVKENAALIVIWGIMYFLLLLRWILNGEANKIPKLDDIAWYLNEMISMWIMLKFMRIFKVCATVEGFKYEKNDDDSDNDNRFDNY